MQKGKNKIRNLSSAYRKQQVGTQKGTTLPKKENRIDSIKEYCLSFEIGGLHLVVETNAQEAMAFSFCQISGWSG